MCGARLLSLFCILCVLPAGLSAADDLVRPDEMAIKDYWICQSVVNATRSQTGPGVHVIRNHVPVSRDARDKQPLKIEKVQYKRGLSCHAPSLLLVKLPGPGRTFTAQVGIDNNADTARGRGSVQFVVQVDNREVLKSEVLRVQTPPKTVTVDLSGSDTFVLQVTDAGDGIAWDQGDWADAKVTMMDGREIWLSDLTLVNEPACGPLFSFTYDGNLSGPLLLVWPHRAKVEELDASRTRHTITWTDPTTQLEVRLVAVDYRDFPVVEWTAWFKNTGSKDTPVLADVLGMDAMVRRPSPGGFVLRTIRGDDQTPQSYQPIEIRMAGISTQRFAPVGGRPTNKAFPYFNVEWPNQQGVITALGWPGQWQMVFEGEDKMGMRFGGGQETLRATLKPGEEVRTPLSVMMFWRGDSIRAQNLWRRWMIAHNIPRPSGQLPAPILSCDSSAYYAEMAKANDLSQILFIDRYVKNNILPDYWWMDAGWYPCDGRWQSVGTWEPDKKRFPQGLRKIADHAHKRKIMTLVWFEPERVAPGTWLYQNRADWLLGADGRDKLLNLGNPAAWKWLCEHIDKVLREQGIDLYRQDFNFDPLGYWRGNDGPDRQGVTENLHVQGYLAYWDELRKRHPDMLIDSCASGGRRNDLETLRRAVPLFESDFAWFNINWDNLQVKQCFHHSLFSWIPYFGTPASPADRVDAYAFRTSMLPAIQLRYDARRDDMDFATLRELVRQWREMGPYFYGDYYPLTPYSLADDDWMAWQFNRPEQGDGMVQAFRRGRSQYESARYPLQGLDPTARYTIRNLDTDQAVEMVGSELMKAGMELHLPQKSSAAVLLYSRKE